MDAQIADAKARIARAESARAAAGANLEKFNFLNDVASWLGTYFGHGGTLAHHPLPSAKLQRGESFKEAVERVRTQLSACDDEWAKIELAPLPAAEIKHRIVAEVDALAADGRPKIAHMTLTAPASPASERRFVSKRRVGCMSPMFRHPCSPGYAGTP